MLRVFKLILLGALAFGLTATLAPSTFAQTNAQTAACDQTYTVQAGDWLSTIAQKLLGDVNGYTAILQATNDASKTDASFATIADANKIEVGQKLCIPAKSATTKPPTAPGPVIPSIAGTYTNVGPAADASALVETLTFTEDFKATDTLDYIGKARITSTGTWTTENFQYVASFTQQDGKPISQKMVFQLDADGNLKTVGNNPTVYTKTSPAIVSYSGLYTSGRKSADGKETLTALALLPNGQVQLTLSSDTNPFILQTGTWTLGKNADTGTDQITVNVTKQGDQTINDTYVFQADKDLLRGTSYNTDKWGTDLTFTKYQPPSEPETPASAPGKLVAITGSYTAQLSAADAIGRVIVLDLQPNNTATLTTQFIGKGDPIVESGTWEYADNLTVTLDSKSSGKQTLTFKFDGGALVLQNPVDAGYGSDGLTLTRVGSDRINNADFGGVTFSFDNQLAQSAKGETTKAVPVSEGPALGGATPASIRFLFNDSKVADFFDPRLAQVEVYKTDDWTKLDPSTAKTVADLQAMLKDKPAAFAKEIPFVPPANAQQVFHAQTKYLDFQNGSGVGFVTYYAQDVSPVTADRIFYTFQGLTGDGKYYVTVFYPVTTKLLPTDYKTALGGMSDDEWGKQYPQYLDKLVKDLDGLNPAAYTPNLMLIEQMIESISVSDATLP